MQMITLYSSLKSRETVINTIETLSQVLSNWFSDKFMKTNRGKIQSKRNTSWHKPS